MTRRFNHRDLSVLIVALLPFAGTAARAADVDFEETIAPLLVRSCLGCHAGAEPAGGLDLRAAPSAHKAGDSGQAPIIDGKIEESEVVTRIRAGEMPPPGRGSRLSEQEIAALENWIKSGASWPEGRVLSVFERTTSTRAGRDWWSLQRPIRPPVPQPARQDRIRTAIDAFVAEKLAREGLELSPDADRRTLIRRATLDLWGLPPTPEEVTAFLDDPFPDAYERLLDRLLASPHYGERWGQHWLDVARFGESEGYETNRGRPTAWMYRDYVIDALNRDKSYAQFISEQLIGDQLAAEIGTGFLVAGPHDIVASPDEELTRQQRQNDLDDILGTTLQAFIGMTVGCAKCHDHKFDPISQRDYYGLQALISGVRHGVRNIPPRTPGTDPRQIDELRESLLAHDLRLRRLLTRYEPLASVNSAAPPIRPPVTARSNVDRFAPVRARFVRFTALAATSAEPCLDEFEVFSATTGENLALASRGAKATASSVLAGGSYPIHQVPHLIDRQYGNSHSWIADEVTGAWVIVELADEALIDCVEWARDREGKFSDRVANRYRIEVATTADNWTVVATSDDRTTDPAASPKPAVYDPADQEQIAKLRATIADLERRIAAAEPAPAYVGVFQTPEPIFLLHRGEVMQRRDEIPPALPAMIGTATTIPAKASDVDRRRALAQWLIDPAHPLTSRVIVNRMWQEHFGRGLVATPSDFGFNGGLPTHPELLDWLACELIAHGWSLKYLHRLMMSSTVYRQQSLRHEGAIAKDAGNQWLWRFQPRRVDAEALHDMILCAAGTMDYTAGGPGYEVYVPDTTSNVRVFEPKPSLGPAEWRRMVYQNKPRMRLDPTFGAFDCPDGSQPVARRNISTTALQSLGLLNSPFMLAQSEQFAQRLQKEFPNALDGQLRRAFCLALGRAPTESELSAARDLASEHGLIQVCRTLFNSNEFVYVR